MPNSTIPTTCCAPDDYVKKAQKAVTVSARKQKEELGEAHHNLTLSAPTTDMDFFGGLFVSPAAEVNEEADTNKSTQRKSKGSQKLRSDRESQSESYNES